MKTQAVSVWPSAVLPIVERAITCEYASLTRSGAPMTWPLMPYHDAGTATIDVSTGLTYPAKAERARHDPRVALLFSDPIGSGLGDAPVVLVQGLATVRDADLQANTDLYLRRVLEKMPQAVTGQPWFVVRRQQWYWSRVWIEVTPLRILWWPGGRLDTEPLRWDAPVDLTAPPSDTAPEGAAPPAWATAPADWRPRADHAMRLGNPVLTVRDADGWPLPVRSLGVSRVDDGFVIRTGPFGAAAAGRACLTFHEHPEVFTGQQNAVFVGTAAPVAGGVHVRVDRALADFSLPPGRFTQVRKFLASGRALTPRLAHEAARRHQPVPVVRKPE
ncbi:MAG: hemerythrin [Kribbellaceae bacterium]|nr:hemerythrin [Kribbellaceae bacterium]